MQLHHLGWAVHSIEASREHFETQLGLPYEGAEEFPTLTVAFFRAGATLIELLEPKSDEDDVAQFLRDRGEGIHHCAYLVDDVAIALTDAEARGMHLMDTVPRPGSRGTTIGFVDPRRADRILVEYVREPTA
ncbi:VOC family protein [Micromonospora sp. RTGN7]|uniref:VOC family protein n=1 Tax=Micromonospora sp. RTGN7 TaxID=3016526 RepID=UPI0029FF06E7|nr:VOC family protein [Micromonospora sp. RTGN7]